MRGYHFLTEPLPKPIPISAQNTTLPTAPLVPQPEPRNVPLVIRPDGTIGRQGISPSQHRLICALQLTVHALDLLEPETRSGEEQVSLNHAGAAR